HQPVQSGCPFLVLAHITCSSSHRSFAWRCSVCARNLTLPSRGRATSGFASCRPPLMSNVRWHMPSTPTTSSVALLGLAMMLAGGVLILSAIILVPFGVIEIASGHGTGHVGGWMILVSGFGSGVCGFWLVKSGRAIF